MKKFALIMMTGLMMLSCSHHTYVVNDNNDANRTTSVAIGYPKSDKSDSKEQSGPQKVAVRPTGSETLKVNFLPNATAFRMSGDYANNVAITLSKDGELLYYPAPTDITADSEPIDLGNGWWLNNQGLGPNSVFTKYTFAEYASLPEVPTHEQLKNSIIPGAKITGFIELPMKLNQANENLEEAKAFVNSK